MPDLHDEDATEYSPRVRSIDDAIRDASARHQRRLALEYALAATAFAYSAWHWGILLMLAAWLAALVMASVAKALLRLHPRYQLISMRMFWLLWSVTTWATLGFALLGALGTAGVFRLVLLAYPLLVTFGLGAKVLTMRPRWTEIA